MFIGSNAGAFTTGGENTFIGSGVTGVDGGAGFYVTTGSKNTIIGKYDGNQGGLDIRTADNYIVLSDGDGNPRAYHDGTNWTVNGGIYIGGTAAANLLDDYEEGLWTPSQGAGLTVTGGFGSEGTYTKVGNMVTVRGQVLAVTSVSLAAAGTILVGNLPFTPAGDSNQRAIGSASDFGSTQSSLIIAKGTSGDLLNASTISTTARIYFSAVYYV